MVGNQRQHQLHSGEGLASSTSPSHVSTVRHLGSRSCASAEICARAVLPAWRTCSRLVLPAWRRNSFKTMPTVLRMQCGASQQVRSEGPWRLNHEIKALQNHVIESYVALPITPFRAISVQLAAL